MWSANKRLLIDIKYCALNDFSSSDCQAVSHSFHFLFTTWDIQNFTTSSQDHGNSAPGRLATPTRTSNTFQTLRPNWSSQNDNFTLLVLCPKMFLQIPTNEVKYPWSGTAYYQFLTHNTQPSSYCLCSVLTCTHSCFTSTQKCSSTSSPPNQISIILYFSHRTYYQTASVLTRQHEVQEKIISIESQGEPRYQSLPWHLFTSLCELE